MFLATYYEKKNGNKIKKTGIPGISKVDQSWVTKKYCIWTNVSYMTARIVIKNITDLMQEQIIFKIESSIILKQTNQFT